MTEPRRPGRIQGEWIWKNSLLNHPDSFLLMRKEFVCNLVELETNLWISANCAYQLFINGRFVGFGPRAHQNCGTSYIDLHEVTYYLESGINVIAVLVYYNADQGGCNKHTPGLWCQMEAQGKIILCSDSTWAVREGGCFCTPRARISKDQGMSQYFNADDCPNSAAGLRFIRWRLPESRSKVRRRCRLRAAASHRCRTGRRSRSRRPTATAWRLTPRIPSSSAKRTRSFRCGFIPMIR